MRLEDIFSKTKIEHCVEQLMQKKNSCGNDGIMLYELSEHLKDGQIISKIITNNYEPVPASEYSITTKNGNDRIIYKLSSVDRMITKLLSEEIACIFD